MCALVLFTPHIPNFPLFLLVRPIERVSPKGIGFLWDERTQTFTVLIAGPQRKN